MVKCHYCQDDIPTGTNGELLIEGAEYTIDSNLPFCSPECLGFYLCEQGDDDEG